MDIKKEYSCLEQNHLVFHRCIDNDEDYQESLPQYCDDVYRVVKCVSNSYITSIDAKYNEIRVMGKNEISLTYLNETSCLCYADFEEEFSKNISVDDLSENAFAFANVCPKYTNFRVINQRRIDIHTSSSIEIRVFDSVKCPCMNKCELSRLKSENIKLASFISSNICKSEFDEEISIPSDSAPIKRIVSSAAFVSSKEVKIIKDKALIKAAVTVDILYTTDDKVENTQKCVHTFDVSKIIDVPDISEDDYIITQMNMGNMFYKAKSSGDKLTVIEIYGEVSMSSVFIREKEVRLITDGYVPSRKSKCSFSDYMCYKDGKLINDKIMVKNEFDLSSDIVEIKQLSLDLSTPTFKGDKLMSSATIYAVCVNNKNEYCSFTSSCDFQIDSPQGDEIIAALSILSYDYSLSSIGKVEVRLSLSVAAYVYNQGVIKVLSDIECDDNELSYPALTVYFAKKQEQVWNIAKSFSSDIDLIIKENELQGDVLDNNKILIIPGI